MKFTFKKEKRDDWDRCSYCTIKLNKKEVGQIRYNPYGSVEALRFTIVKNKKYDDGNPNCKWMWITLLKMPATLEEAKTWLNLNIDSILKEYDLQEV